MNRVILTGIVANDVITGVTKAGKSFAFLTLAVNGLKDTTDFINCNAWSAPADYIGKAVHKGDLVEIEGHITVSKQEKDGRTTYEQKVTADRIKKLRNGKESAEKAAACTEPAEADEPDTPDVPF